ncbi:DUF4349 domain-containing protein [Streptomyces sp. NPDC003691]
MRARQMLAVLMVAGVLTVSGCSASSDTAQSAADKPAAADARAEQAAPEAGGGRAAEAGTGSTAKDSGAKPGSPKPLLSATHRIRTAELQVEVSDVGKAVAAARRIAEAEGGYVSEESSGYENGTGAEGSDSSRIVLRVPQERYGAVLASLSKGGRLISVESSTKDVTGEVVDVTSRIATQRASVARVRELMDRASQLSDIVSLEAELGRRQADLESLLAQQSSLKDRAALSTLTLDYREPEPREKRPEQDDDPGVLDALETGWDALVTVVRWIVIVLSAMLPFLVLLALGAVGWRWQRSRRPGGTAAPERAADADGTEHTGGTDSTDGTDGTGGRATGEGTDRA